jgi:hypothetical protein
MAACQSDHDACILSALDNNNREEVMPIEPNGSADGPRDTGPGDKSVAGAAPRRASGPIDPEAGFATSGAEARWIADVDAGVYDDATEEIGILQARVEDQDRKIADLTRQLQGQPRRQSDVNADTWKPIATAPKDRVIDLWPLTAADTPVLSGMSTARPAGPTEGDSHE